MKTLMTLISCMPFTFLPFSTPVQTASNLLVDTAWVEAHSFDRDVCVVDMRMRGFDEAHIPGAVPIANDAIRIPNRPPYFLPTVEEFEKLMRSHGISNSTRVVVYDDRGGIYAARLWFILNVFGHSNVALLDGGWTKWTKENRKVVGGVTDIHIGTFTAKLNTGMVATAAEIVVAIDKKSATIVDARTQNEIDGKDLRGIKRGGAIPSSKPVYWEDTLNLDDRSFKSLADIETLYHDRGIPATGELIIYCQVGMRASHDAFTLALLGRKNVRVYYGSWEEWGNRDDLPIKK